MDMVGWASCRKRTTYNDILYRSAIPSRKTTRDEANEGTGPFRTTSRLITLPEALTTFGYIVNYMDLLFTCSLLERRICGGHFRCQKSQCFNGFMQSIRPHPILFQLQVYPEMYIHPIYTYARDLRINA
jgi:hypothetical protein